MLCMYVYIYIYGNALEKWTYFASNKNNKAQNAQKTGTLFKKPESFDPKMFTKHFFSNPLLCSYFFFCDSLSSYFSYFMFSSYLLFLIFFFLDLFFYFRINLSLFVLSSFVLSSFVSSSFVYSSLVSYSGNLYFSVFLVRQVIPDLCCLVVWVLLYVSSYNFLQSSIVFCAILVDLRRYWD